MGPAHRYIDDARQVIRPVGYLWTAFVKMVQTVEIALWGTLLPVLLSVPLAYLAARNYAPNRFTYTLARGSISLLRSAPELIDSRAASTCSSTTMWQPF